MTEPARLSHPLFGDLVWNEELNWWERDGFPIPMFGGGGVLLFVKADDPQVPISQDVVEAAEAMLALDRSALELIVPHLWQNYRDCTEMLAEEDFTPVAESEDILAHVHPTNVAFQFGYGDGLVYASFECNCGWEIEHGLQLVLQRGRRWVKVGNYDGHLTDGHALGRELLDAWMNDPEANLPVRSFDDKLDTPKTTGARAK